MDYKFVKGTLSSTNPETIKRIDETKLNVSRETKEYYMWTVDDGVHRFNCDNDGNVILELTNPPVCNNYDYFEDICISECTWCDNPYHCKFKNVSRETYLTIHDIAFMIIVTDYCWNNFRCNFCEDCEHETSSHMTTIAIDMVARGLY